MSSSFRIGTSGWFYEHWKEVFYPAKMKSGDRLPFYAEHFDSVEINNTFYRLPSEKAVLGWQEKVGKNFIFSVKASGYITHQHRLLQPEKTLPLFFERVALLGEKLGPILFQLPPSFKQDVERLIYFISYLPPKLVYTFEFRHPSWYGSSTYEVLRKNNIALCITDLKGVLSPQEITASFTYIRLHGPKKRAYTGTYGLKGLQKWRERVELWKKSNIRVFCYFDNDEKSFAVKDAKMLQSLLNMSRDLDCNSQLK